MHKHRLGLGLIRKILIVCRTSYPKSIRQRLQNWCDDQGDEQLLWKMSCLSSEFWGFQDLCTRQHSTDIVFHLWVKCKKYAVVLFPS